MAIDTDEAAFTGLSNARSIMVAPDGQQAGDTAYVIPVVESGYAQSGEIGELLAYVFGGQGDGEVYRAQVFDVREGVTADNVTARVNLGGGPHRRDAGSVGARYPESRAGPTGA